MGSLRKKKSDSDETDTSCSLFSSFVAPAPSMGWVNGSLRRC